MRHARILRGTLSDKTERIAMRLGILGGSFDPVHYGHLLLAECAREQCSLDHVWLLPASRPPHKRRQELTAAEHRVAMLELAVAGREDMSVSTLETDRRGMSYTVDTLRAARRAEPDVELFFLMGADSLHDLPMWREASEVCSLAVPVVVRRPDVAEPDFAALADLVAPERLEEISQWQVEMPLVDLSSTDIRRRVAAGLSIRYRTPRAVEKYIETHRLYRERAN